MRSLGVLPLVGVLLVGCGLSRAAPAPAPPVAPGSAPPSAAPGPETRSKEVAAPKEAAPAPEPPPPTVPVPKELSPPARELTPTISEVDEARLTRETHTRIQTTEQLVGQIDLEKLTGAQRETLSTVRSFITKARLALTSKDLKEAANLAEKARVLAAELLRATR